MVDGAEASSLTELSGHRFVRRATAHDIPIAIVNGGRTRGDGLATVKVDGGCSPIPALLADDAAADCDGIESIDRSRTGWWLLTPSRPENETAGNERDWWNETG